jgi:hypothetical protein
MSSGTPCTKYWFLTKMSFQRLHFSLTPGSCHTCQCWMDIPNHWEGQLSLSSQFLIRMYFVLWNPKPLQLHLTNPLPNLIFQPLCVSPNIPKCWNQQQQKNHFFVHCNWNKKINCRINRIYLQGENSNFEHFVPIKKPFFVIARFWKISKGLYQV